MAGSPVSPGTVVPNTTVSAGGGTWEYGEDFGGTDEGCFSAYLHNSKTHTATAIIGSDTEKASAAATHWADAYAIGSSLDSCKVYWGVS